MDALRLGLPRGFNIPGLPDTSVLNSGMRLFLGSGGRHTSAGRACQGPCLPACSLGLLQRRWPERRLPSAPPPPPPPLAGCVTSLAGLLLSFGLGEAAQPVTKRSGSEVLDASVS